MYGGSDWQPITALWMTWIPSVVGVHILAPPAIANSLPVVFIP